MSCDRQNMKTKARRACRAADLFAGAQKTVTRSPLGQNGRPIPNIPAAPFGVVS